MAKIGNGRQSFDTMSIRTINSSHIDDESSLGSDSEINGFTCDRQTDKYGFIGGAQQYTETSAQDVPPEVLRQREVKWLDMLSHWDKWMFKRYNKVRLRCQKGIPPALRGRAWLYLSGGKVKKEQNYKKFEELDSEPGDPKWVDVIEKDLHRQFPFHEMFVSRGGHGQQDLFRVLKAYTLYRPDEGYCQAQAPIAAVLLMHMPAEDAFWGLVQICEKYLPGYYSPGLEAIQLDGEILFALLRRISPLAFRHLEKHKIDPILYMTEWFMCAFSRTLPWASVLRVWDMFLCDGVKIIFRVGLVLLKCMLGTREKLKACQGQYETMELLRAIEPRYMQEGFLVREILEVQVTARDVEKEHHTQLKRWKKNRGELNFKSPPRMHGARLIMLAEPPRRQDLLQNPTIVLENPQPTPQLRRGKEEKKSKKKSIKKSKPVEEIPNPYPLPNDRPPRSSDLPPPPPVNSENLESVPLTQLVSSENLESVPLTQLVSSENLESVPLTQLVSSENLESVPLTQLVSSENLESVSLTQLVSSGNLESVPLTQLVSSENLESVSLTQLVSSENLESVSLTQLVSRENLESVSLTQLVSSENLETVPLTKSESSENLESASLTQLVSSENLESVSLTQLVSSKNLETVPLTKSESSENLEYVTLTKSDSPHQQRAPPTDPPTTKESFLQHSTQSLSCTEQDTYL